jgi:hypothetical protein
MWKDPTISMGKNKPLDFFWIGLASEKYVVVIYKNEKHKYFKQPNNRYAKINKFL